MVSKTEELDFASLVSYSTDFQIVDLIVVNFTTAVICMTLDLVECIARYPYYSKPVTLTTTNSGMTKALTHNTHGNSK